MKKTSKKKEDVDKDEQNIWNWMQLKLSSWWTIFLFSTAEVQSVVLTSEREDIFAYKNAFHESHPAPTTEWVTHATGSY